MVPTTGRASTPSSDPAASSGIGTPERAADRGVVGLVALAAAFACRVGAQLIQAVADLPVLPPFEAWQSGALPYPALLSSQLVILMVQVVVIWAAASGRLNLGPRAGRTLAALGLAYAGFMVFRLVSGFTFRAGHPWFDAPLPSLFHLVLAAFVLLTAWLGGQASRP